jgi:6-phosphogluconolactonase
MPAPPKSNLMADDFVVADAPERALAEAMVREFGEAKGFTLALSGGSTPKRLFRLLADEYADRIPWSGVDVYQVDERCVPPEHEDSNWRMISEELLNRLPVGSAHRVEAERSGGADSYEELICRQLSTGDGGLPRFDLVLLGLGEDGHTASLFPGSTALDEHERLYVRHTPPNVQQPRVTMTFPLLQAAARRWFLAAGERKAEAVDLARQGLVPAGRLDDCRWFLDPAAAKIE